MCLDDFIWFDRHSFSIIFGIWESFMDHLGVGLFVCLFVCLSVCLSFCLSVCLRMFGRHFYHISGVVSEHFCSWAGLIFQDNFCHGLVTGQSVTEIILKSQLRPRAEMFRNDPRNMKKMTSERTKL